MRASDGLVVTLAVCVLAGIGVLGCNGVNGAGRIHKGIQAAGDNAQKGDEHPGPHTITASAEPGGWISPSGNISVPRGSSQSFIATAGTGYRVVDILVDGRSVGAVADLFHDDSSSYRFNYVTANHVISASFDANKSR